MFIITTLKYYAPDHEHQGTIHINKEYRGRHMLCHVSQVDSVDSELKKTSCSGNKAKF